MILQSPRILDTKTREEKERKLSLSYPARRPCSSVSRLLGQVSEKSERELAMGRPRNEELRDLTEAERRELRRVEKATSERVDAVKRAKALLLVSAGATFATTGQEAGLSGEAVAQLVRRFNQRGLAVLETAPGRGRKPTYTSEQRSRVLSELQREPDREKDQTATWSLMLLRKALRKDSLPHISAETIRHLLHDAGYTYQRTRTWVHTGYALRKRKSGTVTTYDPETPEKKDGSNWPTKRRKRPGSCSSAKMRPVPIRPSPRLGPHGKRKDTQPCSPTSMSGAEQPSS